MRDLLAVASQFGPIGAVVYAAVHQRGRLPYDAGQIASTIGCTQSVMETRLGLLIEREYLQVAVELEKPWLVPGRAVAS